MAFPGIAYADLTQFNYCLGILKSLLLSTTYDTQRENLTFFVTKSNTSKTRTAGEINLEKVISLDKKFNLTFQMIFKRREF